MFCVDRSMDELRAMQMDMYSTIIDSRYGMCFFNLNSRFRCSIHAAWFMHCVYGVVVHINCEWAQCWVIWSSDDVQFDLTIWQCIELQSVRLSEPTLVKQSIAMKQRAKIIFRDFFNAIMSPRMRMPKPYWISQITKYYSFLNWSNWDLSISISILESQVRE